MEEAVAISADDAAFVGLMTAAQRGDQAAYRQVLQASVPLIRRVARGVGVPAASVDDVVQETLVAVHQVLATFDARRPYSPWLAAIARRRSIDLLRQLGRRATREVHQPIAYENHPDEIDMTARAERESEERRLGELVATLPDGQREAVQVLAIAGKSLDEGAASTGRSKGALKVNLHRAIQALRSRIAGEAGDVGR